MTARIERRIPFKAESAPMPYGKMTPLRTDRMGGSLTELISPPESASSGGDAVGGTSIPRSLRQRLAFPVAFAVAGVVLFACYLRMSLTVWPTSDGAANALQAWDMLHGNVLLHGWALSDVSFYTTELPEYMLVELTRGLDAHVVNIAGALTYTLLVLSAALLAKGKATGAEGYLRMFLAAGIMLSPQLISGSSVLMLQPDHVGTTVPVLLTWLVIDRAGRRPWVPVVVGLMLGWALAADAIVLYIGIAPLLVVSLMRAYQEIVQRQNRLSAARYELSLSAGALVALAIGLAAPEVAHGLGGYHVIPAPHFFTDGTQLTVSVWLTVHGLLLLFGANFYRLGYSFATSLVLLHLVGLALAIWAFCSGLRRFVKTEDWVVQLLVAGTMIIITAYIFGPQATSIVTTREIAAALPFGAVLAGRLLVDRLRSARLLPALALVLLGYVLTLAVNVIPGPAPPANGQLSGWLSEHGYRYGLGNYWLANSVTLTSGNQVRVRAVTTSRSQLVPYHWESQSSWYDPSRHTANFVALISVPSKGENQAWLAQMTQTFGRPARTYQFGKYTVLVWNYNLLTRL
jgi:hypothetical protein